MGGEQDHGLHPSKRRSVSGSDASDSARGCGVIELRRYDLRPGARETLIELFEREFVETQEAGGIRVLGTFRDADDPTCFVWLRGFLDMPSRLEALRAFYEGPVWARHKDAANATMISSDNVLLLRPLDRSSRLALDSSRRPPAFSSEHGGRRRGHSLSATACDGSCLPQSLRERNRAGAT